MHQIDSIFQNFLGEDSQTPRLGLVPTALRLAPTARPVISVQSFGPYLFSASGPQLPQSATERRHIVSGAIEHIEVSYHQSAISYHLSQENF